MAKQAGYGAAVAGVELISEKLFDGLAGIYGKGAADDLVEKVIQKMTKTADSHRALNVMAAALGEAGEEAFSGINETVWNQSVNKYLRRRKAQRNAADPPELFELLTPDKDDVHEEK